MLGKYNDALNDFSFFLKMKDINNENKIYAYEYIGLSYLRLDSVSCSNEYLEKIFKLDSLSIYGLYLKAAIYSNENNSKKAIECYNEIISRDSNSVNIFLYRGSEYYEIDSFNLAIIDLKKYNNISGSSLFVNNELGYTFQALKKYDVAISYFKSCLKYEPNSSEIYNDISWTYFLDRKYQEGLIYANKAILSDNRNENAFDTRGCIYFKLGKYKEAIQDFNITLSIDSLLSNSHYFRALSFFKTHEFSLGCKDLNTLILDKNYEIIEGEKLVEILIAENCRNN